MDLRNTQVGWTQIVVYMMGVIQQHCHPLAAIFTDSLFVLTKKQHLSMFFSLVIFLITLLVGYLLFIPHSILRY